MKRAQKLTLAVPIVLGSALASAADRIGPGKLESEAAIWVSSKTRFSGFALPPGPYLLQHRIDGSEHIMTFLRLREGNYLQSLGTYKRMPIRVRCKVEPLPAKASQTAFYYVPEGESYRATRLEIEGENVAHTFPLPGISVAAQ